MTAPLSGARILALGGKHRIFELTCAAIALRELGAKEGEGGSGGAIAVGLAMAGMSRAHALQVARDFDLNALRDGSQPRKGLGGIGVVEGRAFDEKLSQIFADLGHERWTDFRHPRNARPPGSDWDYSLTVRVAVYTFANRSIDRVRHELDHDLLRAKLLTRIAANHHLLVPYTFPFSEGRAVMAQDGDRVVPALVDSARHMLVFQPDLIADGPHVRAVMDGAMFVNMDEFKRVMPDRPTVLLRFGRDDEHGQQQADNDRNDYPGYFVIRAPDSYPGMSKVGKHTIDLSLNAEQRVALAQQGFDDIDNHFDPAAFEAYTQRWGELRAQAFAPANEPGHGWKLPSFPGRLMMGRHQFRPATDRIALPADTPEPYVGPELSRSFEIRPSR